VALMNITQELEGLTETKHAVCNWSLPNNCLIFKIKYI